MEFIKTLSNNNQLALNTVYQEKAIERSTGFSFRLVFGGQEHYTSGSRSITLYPGHFLWLNEGISYSREINSSEPVSSFSIEVTREFFGNFIKSVESTTQNLLDNPFKNDHLAMDLPLTILPLQGDLKYTVINLKRNLEAGYSDDLLLNTYLHHYLINYYKIFNAEVISRLERLDFLQKSTRIEILKRLLLAKDFILSNYHSKLTLEEIAGVACLSKNHLLRSFRQAYNISPYQFLIRVRLERARDLLETGDYQVKDIAATVGFDCTSSFISFFKKTYSHTPARYPGGSRLMLS
ncbi:MAG TPA: helix-turn-helix transcriptional regulator [Sphingobacteriaceae bacterium]